MRHIELEKYRPTICIQAKELLLNEEQVSTVFQFFLHANVFLHVEMGSAWPIYFTQFFILECVLRKNESGSVKHYLR